MKFCPNAACAHYSGNHMPSTFDDMTQICPECATLLVEEPTGNWVAITNPLLSIEAQLFRDKLLGKGIPAYITDDNVSSFYILTTFGGAQVMVREQDHQRAFEILEKTV